MFAPSEDTPFPFSCQPYFLISPTQVCLLGGAKEVCPTDLYTHSGECCKACNLGEGVAQPCGANQTVCEPCLDSEYRMGGGGGGGSGAREEHAQWRPHKCSASWQGLLPTTVWVPEVGLTQYRSQRGEAESG